MTSSEDRYVKPVEGEDPRAIDREQTDAAAMAAREAGRSVSHDQAVERAQGLSSDRPGIDPSDRERALASDGPTSATSSDAPAAVDEGSAEGSGDRSG